MVAQDYKSHLLVILIPLVFAIGQCYKTDFLGTIPYKINSNSGYRYRKESTSGPAITLRLDKDIVCKLKSEANNQDLSINAVTNQVLKRYVEWNIFEQKSGMISISAPVLIELLRRISEEEIVNIAKTFGKNAARDITLFVKGKIDTDSFVSWFLTRMKNCSVIEEINHSTSTDGQGAKNYGEKSYILKHQLGYKWSLFHKTVLESIFSEILSVPIETQITDSILMFRIKEPEKPIA
jgi:hypothetical protein